LEYSSLGSLPDAWEKLAAKGEPLGTDVKLQLSLDVGRGLRALHDCDIVEI
jgi:hypothetical protein